MVEVELTRDRFANKGFREGESVYLQPKRLRTFNHNSVSENTIGSGQFIAS